ncbi:DUF3986 family protein, partial [Bacillus haynesii]
MNYDETKHLHISYNKKGLDLEAIGLKRLDVDMWDVYFNFQDHSINEPPLRVSKVNPFGCKIFSIASKDLS